jgi:hypothetical protein
MVFLSDHMRIPSGAFDTSRVLSPKKERPRLSDLHKTIWIAAHYQPDAHYVQHLRWLSGVVAQPLHVSHVPG